MSDNGFPAGLGQAGATLWSSMAAALPPGWQFDDREIALLEMACRQADAVAELEAAVDEDGVMVKGSTGQPVCNPALAEARQGRLTVSRLIGQLALPGADGVPRTAATKQAHKAAAVRWAG